MKLLPYVLMRQFLSGEGYHPTGVILVVRVGAEAAIRSVSSAPTAVQIAELTVVFRERIRMAGEPIVDLLPAVCETPEIL